MGSRDESWWWVECAHAITARGARHNHRFWDSCRAFYISKWLAGLGSRDAVAWSCARRMHRCDCTRVDRSESIQPGWRRLIIGKDRDCWRADAGGADGRSVRSGVIRHGRRIIRTRVTIKVVEASYTIKCGLSESIQPGRGQSVSVMDANGRRDRDAERSAA